MIIQGKMIKYSRHAKRRMKLYSITGDDIKSVIEQGKREISQSGNKTSIIHRIPAKFKYPIKVIGVEEGDSFLVISAYPLKKGKE